MCVTPIFLIVQVEFSYKTSKNENSKGYELARLEDSHENATLFPDEKGKSFRKKQLKNGKHDENEITKVYKNKYSKYYVLIYCKYVKGYLWFISLWPNICNGFSDNLLTIGAAELYFHIKNLT